MARLIVKICGVRDEAAARACVEADADFAGLNLVPESRRYVAPGRIAELLPSLGPVVPVGVFRDNPPEHVHETARELGLEWVQLHGSESPGYVASLATDLKIIKALGHDHVGDAKLVEAFAPHVSLFVVDGRVPGSGAAWDWTMAKGIVTDGLLAGRPVMLAGGLHPDNVAEAVAALHPAGVDAASGVERGGHQDPRRILAFCRAARAAAEELE